MEKITLKLGHHIISQVEEICCVGSRITSDGRSKKDIVSRIAHAKRHSTRRGAYSQLKTSACNSGNTSSKPISGAFSYMEVKHGQ
jgi:hypothetical protein